MSSQLALFGGSIPWISPSTGWKTVDDRVRGGSSVSNLTVNSSTNSAVFSGILDTKTLGAAGFASQVTTGDTVWDLSLYEGLWVEIEKSDGMQYTLIIKDDIQQDKRDDGREKASINWEVDFQIGDKKKQEEGDSLRFAWTDFKAFYRGRERKNVGDLNTKEIQRFSVMARSHFGNQEGPFRLELRSITAANFSATEDQGPSISRGSQKQLGNL
ncbi:MAG: hypothetical protein MMC33_004477 [Icmadophila ericetorum]|nr:hypothetical protein [Icmadophila ericetorum]